MVLHFVTNFQLLGIYLPVTKLIFSLGVDPLFNQKLFSNENVAHFWLNGYVNKHLNIWNEDNPQAVLKKPEKMRYLVYSVGWRYHRTVLFQYWSVNIGLPGCSILQPVAKQYSITLKGQDSLLNKGKIPFIGFNCTYVFYSNFYPVKNKNTHNCVTCFSSFRYSHQPAFTA